MKIKTHFNGWKEVTKDEALDYAKMLYYGMTARDRVNIINSRLDGLKVTEVDLRGY